MTGLSVLEVRFNLKWEYLFKSFYKISKKMFFHHIIIWTVTYIYFPYRKQFFWYGIRLYWSAYDHKWILHLQPNFNQRQMDISNSNYHLILRSYSPFDRSKWVFFLCTDEGKRRDFAQKQSGKIFNILPK